MPSSLGYVSATQLWTIHNGVAPRGAPQETIKKYGTDVFGASVAVYNINSMYFIIIKKY